MNYKINKKNEIVKLFITILVYILFTILYLANIINLHLLLVIIIVILALTPIVKLIIFKSKDALNPQNLLPFVFMFYTLGPLLYYEVFSRQTITLYLLYQLIGLIALKMGLAITTNKKEQPEVKKDNIQKKKRNFKVMTILFLGITVVSMLTELVAFRGIRNMLRIGYGAERFNIISQSIVIGSGTSWFSLLGIIIWTYGLIYNKKLYKIIGYFTMFFSLILLLKIGDRSTLIYAAIYLTVIYHNKKKRLTNRFIIGVLVIGIVFSQLFSSARYYLPGGITYAVKSTVNIFMKKPELYLPMPWNIGEFVAPARSLMEILEYGGPGLQYGKTYISVLGSTIPFLNRILSPISMNPNIWLLNEYYPHVLATGGGNGFSPVAEGYINFGIAGIFIHMFLYGYIVKKVYLNYKHKKNMKNLLLYAAFLPLFLLDGMRIHAASFTHKLFRTYLFPVILLILVDWIRTTEK